MVTWDRRAAFRDSIGLLIANCVIGPLAVFIGAYDVETAVVVAVVSAIGNYFGHLGGQKYRGAVDSGEA